jgi:hypothetical protein
MNKCFFKIKLMEKVMVNLDRVESSITKKVRWVNNGSSGKNP